MFRVLALLVVLLAGCQKTECNRCEQTLRINIGTDPVSLDPRKARDLNAVTLMHMLFEGLTRTSKTSELEMAIAEEIEVSEDGLQYIFSLRPSFWSNGDLVTSFDFAESWKTILDPQFPTDIAYQLYVIKNGRKAKLGEIGLEEVGIQTPDPQTLIVELEQPVPYFLDLLTLSSFLPISHKVANANPNWALSPEDYVCNGPFVLEDWNHADQIRVVRNSRYWQADEVHLTAIDLTMMAPDTELKMFEEGKLDWAGSPLSTIPADAVVSLKAEDKLQISPFSATYFYRVNVSDMFREKKNPMACAHFRKALAFSLNRKAITEHILQGGHTPATSLVPPQMGLSQKGYFHDDYQEMARAQLMDALAALDLTLEALPSITISYASSDRNVAIAQAVQKQWEEGLGIKVELEAVEPKVFYQKVAQKQYQIAAGSWTADFNDPTNFLEVFKYKDASTNNTNWENPKYIDLLNQSALCRDLEERKGLLREAEQVLIEQMPIIPIFHYAMNFLQRDRLEEVAFSPLGQVDFRWARMSLEPTLEKR